MWVLHRTEYRMRLHMGMGARAHTLVQLDNLCVRVALISNELEWNGVKTNGTFIYIHYIML